MFRELQGAKAISKGESISRKKRNECHNEERMAVQIAVHRIKVSSKLILWRTSRDQPKSALNLSLKNSKRTSKCQSILFYSSRNFFKKSLAMPKKPLVSSGFVCYVGNFIGPVSRVNRGNLKFCIIFGRTILVTSRCIEKN